MAGRGSSLLHHQAALSHGPALLVEWGGQRGSMTLSPPFSKPGQVLSSATVASASKDLVPRKALAPWNVHGEFLLRGCRTPPAVCHSSCKRWLLGTPEGPDLSLSSLGCPKLAMQDMELIGG